MIYVTHDQVEAMTMADKIVVLNAGNIEQVGSPLELYRSPKNIFVAGFIGSPKMNIVEGAEAAKHDAKTIGVRPEHISVSTTPVEGAWKGTVGVAEHLGVGHLHPRRRPSTAPSTSAPTATFRSTTATPSTSRRTPSASTASTAADSRSESTEEVLRWPFPFRSRRCPSFPASVARPAYARADLSPGILHFGIGNFHRAHLQVYLDRLMNAGRDRDWAIVGAGVTPYDVKMRDALQGQDWLSTVVEQSAETSSARVTGVMTDFLPPMDGPAILRQLSLPATGIVSMTVTEGGYFINPSTGAFDPENTSDRRRRRTTRRAQDGVWPDPRRPPRPPRRRPRPLHCALLRQRPAQRRRGEKRRRRPR